MSQPSSRRPFENFQTLRRLNSVLDEAFSTWPFQQESGSITSSWYPACDVFEDKDAVKIVAELPGVKPEEVKLSLENTLLTIRGEKKQEAEERSERQAPPSVDDRTDGDASDQAVDTQKQETHSLLQTLIS